MGVRPRVGLRELPPRRLGDTPSPPSQAGPLLLGSSGIQIGPPYCWPVGQSKVDPAAAGQLAEMRHPQPGLMQPIPAPLIEADQQPIVRDRPGHASSLPSGCSSVGWEDSSMTRFRLVRHAPGAPGLRWLGLGPGLRPSRGLLKLQRLFNS